MEKETGAISREVWDRMAEEAWKCRENAWILGDTKVGAALLTKAGDIYSGCNIEHVYRCHDVHAEVNAISTMVASGRTEMACIIVTAEREKFTPCGACMDWIFQFGGPDCRVGYQTKRGGEIVSYLARELMPHYPR